MFLISLRVCVCWGGEGGGARTTAFAKLRQHRLTENWSNEPRVGGATLQSNISVAHSKALSKNYTKTYTVITQGV